MKHYCTNCGAETETRICESCGVKNNKVHKFCYWCGAQIDENASICLACREKVNAVKTTKLKIGRILLVIWTLIGTVGFFTDGCYIASIILLVATVLAVPVWSNIFAHATHQFKQRNLLRPFLKVAGVVLFVFLYSWGWNIGMEYDAKIEASQSAPEQIYTAEEQELYNYVLLGYGEIYDSLKNPDSLKVYGVKKYDDEIIAFKVTATNGFGGTVTEYFAYNGALLSGDDAQWLYKGEDIDWDEVVKYSQTLKD